MAESLAPDVHRLLISPVTGSFVKKKAALTLLRLYRKHPSVIPLAEWGERVTTIMDDENLVCMFSIWSSCLVRETNGTPCIVPQGVALAVTSLVTTLAQDNQRAMESCYPKAVSRLQSARHSHAHSKLSSP